MAEVQLVPHDASFAERMWELVSDPEIKDVLGIPDKSVEDTRNFIIWITEEEKNGKQLSRVILNADGELIGVTTLMSIDGDKERCHVGTWIGKDYWGMGYNHASKVEILKIAKPVRVECDTGCSLKVSRKLHRSLVLVQIGVL